MGDSLETWRCRIGLHSGAKSSSQSSLYDLLFYTLLLHINDGPTYIQMCLLLCIISTLLKRSGVESNPGPNDLTLKDLANLITSTNKETETNIKKAIDDVNLSLTNQITSLNESVTNLKSELAAANATIVSLEDKIEELECKNRRNNLLLFNVPISNVNEENVENVYETAIEFCKTNLNISLSVTDINYCIRIGKKNDKRPILVSLVHYRNKVSLFKNASLLKDSDFSISDDLTVKGRIKKQVIHKKFIEAKEAGYKNIKKFKHALRIDGVQVNYNSLLNDTWLDVLKDSFSRERSDSLESSNSKGSGNGGAPRRGGTRGKGTRERKL